MNSQKFQTNSYCVGGKHYSGTKIIAGEITINKKTGKKIKLLVGKCSICNRKKSMIVTDNTIQAEVLGDFFKNLGRKGLNVSKQMAKKRIKLPRTGFRFNSDISYSSSFSKFQTGFINITRIDKVLQYMAGPLPW